MQQLLDSYLREATTNLQEFSIGLQSRSDLVSRVEVEDVIARYLGAVELLQIVGEELSLKNTDARSNTVEQEIVLAMKADGELLYACSAVFPVLGHSPLNLIGQSLFSLMDRTSADDFAATLLLMEGGSPEPITITFPFAHREGSVCIVRAFLRQILGGQCQPHYLIRGRVTGTYDDRPGHPDRGEFFKRAR